MKATPVLLDLIESRTGSRPRADANDVSDDYLSYVHWTQKVIELCGSSDPIERGLALSAWRELELPEVMVEAWGHHMPNIPRQQYVHALTGSVRLVLPLLEAHPAGHVAVSDSLDRVERWCGLPEESAAGFSYGQWPLWFLVRTPGGGPGGGRPWHETPFFQSLMWLLDTVLGVQRQGSRDTRRTVVAEAAGFCMRALVSCTHELSWPAGAVVPTRQDFARAFTAHIPDPSGGTERRDDAS